METTLQQIKTADICPLNLGKMKILEIKCFGESPQYKLDLLKGICMAMVAYKNQDEVYYPTPEYKEGFDFGQYLITKGYLSFDDHEWCYFLGEYSND